MYSKNSFFAIFAATALIAACASKPVNMPSIPENASTSAEIEKTERMVSDARQQQMDVLSPKNFEKAEKHLAKAKEMKEKNKANGKIIEELAYAQGFIADGKNKSEISTLSMKNITTAREDALKANAPELLPEEWKKIEEDLESVTKKVEKGNLTKADKEGTEIIAQYRELEIRAIQKANLGVAAENIERAKKAGAEKKAPKSWGMAVMKYDNASKIIVSNPKNSQAIRAAASDATRESVHLTDVVNKVNAGNSEELVLMTERQQRQIGSLRKEASSTEKELATTERENQAMARKQRELQKSQDALKTAEALRGQLKPSEAEVFVDQGKIKVRLKALQFPPSQSTLGPKNQALLNKVDSALQGLGVSRVTIEGHTDATGNADKNALLSEKRAQSVENYLTSKGSLKPEQVQAVGLGSDDPIGDNSTQRGRSENRRIDLVIETE